MSLPAVTVVGTLTQDVELRFIASGKAVANVNIASNARKFNKETQQWEDGEATFLRGNLWGKDAENLAESLTKGARVIATGQLKQRSWEDKEGNKRTSYELDIDEIGPSLKFHTATVMKAGKTGSAKPVASSDVWGGSSDEPDW